MCASGKSQTRLKPRSYCQLGVNQSPDGMLYEGPDLLDWNKPMLAVALWDALSFLGIMLSGECLGR